MMNSVMNVSAEVGPSRVHHRQLAVEGVSLQEYLVCVRERLLEFASPVFYGAERSTEP